MRFPISHITPRECAIWVGAGLAWTLADGVPGASARPDQDFARIADSAICRARIPQQPADWTIVAATKHGRRAMQMASIKAIVAVLAITFAVSACAPAAKDTAADQGSDMQGNRDLAKWVAGIDSTQG